MARASMIYVVGDEHVDGESWVVFTVRHEAEAYLRAHVADDATLALWRVRVAADGSAPMEAREVLIEAPTYAGWGETWLRSGDGPKPETT